MKNNVAPDMIPKGSPKYYDYETTWLAMIVKIEGESSAKIFFEKRVHHTAESSPLVRRDAFVLSREA